MDFALDGLDTITRANKGVWMPIKQPGSTVLLKNQKGDPVELLLIGADSDEFQRMERAALLDRVSRGATSGLSEEQIAKTDEKAIETIALCTRDWKGVIDTKGEPIPFSVETAKAFYRRFPEARDQADRFIGNRANFLLASAKA